MQWSPNRPLTPGRKPITPGRVSFGRTRQVMVYRESQQERVQKQEAAQPALDMAETIRQENERMDGEEHTEEYAEAPSGEAEGAEGAVDPTSAALLSALVRTMLLALCSSVMGCATRDGCFVAELLICARNRRWRRKQRC